VSTDQDPGDYARLAAALAESEERYRAVVAGLEEGITLHDAEGRILAANPSATRILGVPEDALLGMTLTGPEWAIVDGRGQPLPADQHPLAIVLATGEPSPIGLVGVHDRMGELHWLQLTATPIAATHLGGTPQPPGAPPSARVACSFADVTFARHEEEQQQRTELNFRTLIERTPDAIAVYQRETISFVNPRMVQLLGYDSAGELLGRHPLEFVFPDDRGLVERRMRTYAGQGVEGPPAEERLRRRDGSPVPVEVTTIPIFFDSAPATLVHARDLTERKRLEAQVVMADRLASVGRLAAAVGHEINNPLAYVMANLDLALERLAEPSERAPDRLADIGEMLREAREGSDRVRHIVRDLKVFSRGETEERTRVDPRRVLDSCVNMARAEIRPRARLVKRYGETPAVLANEARLGQVLLNLLVNAAHAIPEGAPEFHEIKVSTSCDDRGWVVIEVSDTGAGIPDDVKRRIFEPFFSTKGPGRGSGLGLSICQSIVLALGGEIGFESQVGRGTKFHIVLPATAGPPSEPPLSR
jgi:PAS domain S-box-containing protein